MQVVPRSELRCALHSYASPTAFHCFLLAMCNSAKRDIETVKSVRMASDRETVEIVYKEDGESDYILKYKPYTLDRNKEIKYSNDEAVRIACKILYQ